MITTKGKIIEINGKTEWLLFHRLSKKINPVDFLSLTDSLILFPDFLFAVSFLLLTLTRVDLQTNFIASASSYFCGQIIINLRIVSFIFKPLNMPLLVFQKFHALIVSGIFAVGFIFLGWWNLIIIPSYLIAVASSLLVLTSFQKKYYHKHLKNPIGYYGIFKNNAFLSAYNYYAMEYKLPSGTSPTEEETKDQDWLKPYNFMRTHWSEIESHFNKKARIYWRLYLHIEK
jgi:hypothetical protein